MNDVITGDVFNVHLECETKRFFSEYVGRARSADIQRGTAD